MGAWLAPESIARGVLVLPDHSAVVTWARTLELWPMRREPVAGGEGDILKIGPARSLGVTNVRGSPEASLSADGRTLAIAYDWDRGRGVIIDLEGERPRRMIRQQRLYRVAVSPTGRWVAGSDRHGPRSVGIWDGRSGERLEEWQLKLEARLAFSPDGKWLATCTSGECVLRATGSWEPLWRTERDPAAELDDPVVFSPDSSQVAITHKTRSVRLLSVANGKELVTLEAPEARSVLSLAFDSTGSRLAVFSKTRTHVWDLLLLRRQLAESGLDWPAPKIAARTPVGPPIVAVDVVE